MPLSRTRQRGASVLSVLVVLIGLLVLAAFTVPYFFTYYLMRQLTEGKPGMAMKPVPLPEAPVADAKPTVLAIEGFEIAVPWSEVDRKYDTDFSRSFYFSGRWLWVERRVAFLELFTNAKDSQASQGDVFEKAYGLRVPSDPYDAARFLLEREARPPSIVAGYRKMASELMLANAKRSLLPDPTNAIYSFETPQARGFQLNKPEGAVEVRLLLFFPKEKPLSLALHRAPTDPPFTQPEINFIIRNARVEKEKPTAPKSPGKAASRSKQKAAGE